MEEEITGVEARLDTLIRLIAHLLIKGQTLQDQVGTLTAAGLRPVEIADLLHLETKRVTSIQVRLKKKRKGGTK